MNSEQSANPTLAIGQIAAKLLNRSINITDLVTVDRPKGMFRFKILDETDKKALLDSSRSLKTIPTYQRVYINRDLTFKQRQVLFEKRTRRREDQSNSDSAPQPDGSQSGAPNRALN